MCVSTGATAAAPCSMPSVARKLSLVLAAFAESSTTRDRPPSGHLTTTALGASTCPTRTPDTQTHMQEALDWHPVWLERTTPGQILCFDWRRACVSTVCVYLLTHMWAKPLQQASQSELCLVFVVISHPGPPLHPPSLRHVMPLLCHLFCFQGYKFKPSIDFLAVERLPSSTNHTQVCCRKKW